MLGPPTDIDDSEDAPFVLTPEYEAMADIRFEAAINSGAIQVPATVDIITAGDTTPWTWYSSNYVEIADHTITATSPLIQ